LLIDSAWPSQGAEALVDPAAEKEMNWVVRLISEIRSAKSEMNVPPGTKVTLAIQGMGEAAREWLVRHDALIRRLARVEAVEHVDAIPRNAIQIVLDEATIGIPLAGLIDFDAERQRLEKAIAKADAEISKIEKKLGNEKFVANAPEEVVQENRDRLTEEQAQRAKLADALSRIRSAE
jgi:valyl-tRNA synthetase